ncbi:MAG TPA: T9SS type A sorting domain-containing protein [Chitinophagales bacterium]|nr:T9SS type A sorting domain-containing protein [Chitinophagales bacterium]
MKTYNAIKLYLIFFCLQLGLNMNAQIPTSTVYDYQNINTNSFPIDKTGSPGNSENDYLYSSLYICQKISQTIASYNILTTYPTTFTINNPTTNVPFFSVTVSEYAKQYPGMPNFRHRMVFIRPYTTSPSTNKRRTILISSGVNTNITNWANYYVEGVSDFLMRGYCVAFTEHLLADLSNRYGLLYGANLVSNGCTSITNPAVVTYGCTQFAIAATQYLRGKENDYGVDVNNIFAVGHSFGSAGIYGLAYSKQTDFPNIETIRGCPNVSYLLGYLDNLTLDIYKTQPKNVRAIGILGGATTQATTNQLNIFDPTDNQVPAIIMHGAKDNSIRITNYPYPGYNTAGIKQQLLLNGIPFVGVVTCDGHHEVVTYNGMPNNPAFTYADTIASGNVEFIPNNNFLNIQYVGKPYLAASVTYFNVLANNTNLLKYAFFGKQMHDIARNTALFFNLSTICTPSANFVTCVNNGNGTSANVFKYFKTTSFPFTYPSQINGHLVASTCTIPNLRIKNPELKEEKIEITQNTINVFPSPANNYVNVDFSFKDGGNVSISIFDMLGREAISLFKNQNIESGEYNELVNVSNLSNGLYKVVMKTDKGEIITKSITIQK